MDMLWSIVLTALIALGVIVLDSYVGFSALLRKSAA